MGQRESRYIGDGVTQCLEDVLFDRMMVMLKKKWGLKDSSSALIKTETPLTRVSVFHPSLLVHYNTSGGIGRTLSQKISHRAIKLVPVGKPVVESLLTGILAITTTNEHNFHRHHLLHLLSKKNPSQARVSIKVTCHLLRGRSTPSSSSKPWR